MLKDIKPLAFYLPQYHPTPQNDEWWSKGFTEWTNVGKAKPLYRGHKQPLCPADLGYYDLRVPEVREQQAQMAKDHGIYGFIYYHYWFGGGNMVLERIAEEVLISKKPDFPFCFCWANETWSGIWHGLDNKILAEQKYLGEKDVADHFRYLLPFFEDDRYIAVDGKPLIMIYEPEKIPNSYEYLNLYRKMAEKSGLKGLYIVASSKGRDDLDYMKMGYDAAVSHAFHVAFDKATSKWRRGSIFHRAIRRISKTFGKDYSRRGPVRIDAKEVFNDILYKDTNVETYPMVLPNWDNTPRSGRRGIVLEGAGSDLFEKECSKAVTYLASRTNKENFVIIKSWNEWAEGNILEPDREHRFSYLEVVKRTLT